MLLRRWLQSQSTHKAWSTRRAITLIAFTIAMTTGGWAQRPVESNNLGLEILLRDESWPRIRFERGGATLIPRNRLKITDPNAAGAFTAIDVWAERNADGMKVRLSVIYNDISNQEWWKDKSEKIVGTYLIRDGDTVRPAELEQFGIEPFEMKAIDAKPVVLPPGEGPRITNSNTLEVARLEKHLDGYRFWLKNRSDKNIVAYTISIGNTGIGTSGVGHGTTDVVLARGATSEERYLSASQVERGPITVRFVLFDDGTFEGDPNIAAQFHAKAEGVRIQSPSVLRMIERTLKIDDLDLRAAFDKLEADLWVIPEAIDKSSALQYLKVKFPVQDEKTRSALYEDLKGGLYDSRNIALSEIGETRRYVQALEERGQYASAVESIRRTLERLKQTFEKITSTQ